MERNDKVIIFGDNVFSLKKVSEASSEIMEIVWYGSGVFGNHLLVIVFRHCTCPWIPLVREVVFSLVFVPVVGDGMGVGVSITGGDSRPVFRLLFGGLVSSISVSALLLPLLLLNFCETKSQCS